MDDGLYERARELLRSEPEMGKKVLAVLEFYCHTSLREDREAMAAVETVAASLGQMLARTQERGRAEELTRQQEILLDSVADSIFGVDRHGMVSFANPAAARLLGASPESLIGKPVHELLHGAAPSNRKCAEDCPLRKPRIHVRRQPARTQFFAPMAARFRPNMY